MNAKRNMCLAAIAIAIAAGIAATVLPTHNVFSQIYQYKKVSLKHLYSFPPDQEFEENKIMNGQNIWENEEKIEIKGKLYFDRNYKFFQIADVDYKSDGRVNNSYKAFLKIKDQDRHIIKKLLEAAYDCENFALANNGRLDYDKAFTYVNLRGSLAGNFPYEFKNKKGEAIRFWGTAHHGFISIEVDDVDTCLTREEYDGK